MIKIDIYRSFEQWKNGNVLEHDVPRTKYYSKQELSLIEMGWKYGYDARLAEQPAQPHRSGLVAIRTLLSRDPCIHANTAIQMIDAMLAEQPAQQEPVVLPCCGYTDASAVKWNPYNQVVQCHNCGQVYTTPQAQPAREWVGLSDDEMLYCVELENPKAIAEEVEAKLKEKNA